jgi:preprotein translocase subunit SecF
LTAGLTFLTVLALYLFGGEVLHGFSFALVIGILIGTYSSIAIAAPILVAYQDWRVGRASRPVMGPGKQTAGDTKGAKPGAGKGENKVSKAGVTR